MRFDIDADSALVAAASAFAAAALIWIEILWLRRRQARETRIARDVTDRWHPILSLASFGIAPEQLPPLHKNERSAFLKLWIYLQTSLRGDARAALSSVARQLNCDVLALKMLARGDRGDKLLATIVAGHLGLVPALRLLLVHTDSRDSVLSLQAFQSVLRISPEVVATLVPQCVQRVDWPVSQLLPSLRDCVPWLAAPLLGMLDSRDEREVARTLELIAGLRIPVDLPLQQRLLRQTSPALLAASLPLVDQAALLGTVRACLRHEDSRVRAAAAKALSRAGTADDLDTLEVMLCDLSWKVRNSAARAIVALPGGGTDALRTIGDRCTDRYGRNMAEHVLAEIRLAG